MKSRPVVIVFSILAALQVLTGAAALGEVIGDTAFALFAIAVAAVQVGMTFYVQNITVPYQDVAAYQSSSGSVVAGPAAGATNGTPVSVEPGTAIHSRELGRPEGMRRKDELGLAGDARVVVIAAAVSLVVLIVVLAVLDVI